MTDIYNGKGERVELSRSNEEIHEAIASISIEYKVPTVIYFEVEEEPS